MFFYDANNPEKLWIHLHGFATDVWGSKIEFARNYFKRTGTFSFFAMDMDYEKHTTTEVLDVLEALVLGFSQRFENITLCGSSHGAYVAVNYLRFRKRGNIKTLLLLAPSFETLGLIIKELGEEKVSGWLKGKEPLRLTEEGREVEIREDFAADIVEVVIVHGKRDEVVPVERSRLFASKVRVKRFIEVEDDHQLSSSFGRILAELVSSGML